MYDSLSNGEVFSKPKFNYTQYLANAFTSPIIASNETFESKPDLEAGDLEDVDDGTDAPKTFRSQREQRIYLGRGFNRLRK